MEKNKLKIEYLPLNALKEYENNPRKNDRAVEYVKNSIKEFGFKNPIILDKDNVIIAGHTRFKASQELGLHEVPCVHADDLTEEQVKAFRIADNKVSEFALWDSDKLRAEIYDIETIDIEDFGINKTIALSFDTEIHDYGDERMRTAKAYNLDILYESRTEMSNDFWQMPIIKKDDVIPTSLIGFNYAKSSKDKKCGIHFFIDDYQFERIWANPQKYVDILKDYECILSMDFSLYMNMPMPMKIYNIYRSRQMGSFYQSQGIKVIPTISWAEEETFRFCFLGIEKGSTVAVSTVGVKEKEESIDIWKKGMDEAIKQIEPSKILLYGGRIDYDFGNLEVYEYENNVLKKWKEG